MPLEGSLISEVTAGQMIAAVKENTAALKMLMQYFAGPRGLGEVITGLTNKLDTCFDPERAIIDRAASLVRIDEKIDRAKDDRIEELKQQLAAALAATPARPAESQ